MKKYIKPELDLHTFANITDVLTGSAGNSYVDDPFGFAQSRDLI